MTKTMFADMTHASPTRYLTSDASEAQRYGGMNKLNPQSCISFACDKHRIKKLPDNGLGCASNASRIHKKYHRACE
jgi:hypothetical protein